MTLDSNIIIRCLFQIHKDRFPAQSWHVLENIGVIKPGLESEAAKFMLANMSALISGRMIVLSGPVGCGKTIASYIGTLLYLWECNLSKIYERDLDNLSKGNTFEYRDYEIKAGPESDMAFNLTLTRHSKSNRNGKSFVLLRAFDVLKDALKTDSREIASFKGLVVIDDLGREYFTDRGFGIAEWDAFFDLRYSECLPTIITTNLTDKEFVEKYNDRIKDRMKECAEWIVITEKSMRRAK